MSSSLGRPLKGDIKQNAEGLKVAEQRKRNLRIGALEQAALFEKGSATSLSHQGRRLSDDQAVQICTRCFRKKTNKQIKIMRVKENRLALWTGTAPSLYSFRQYWQWNTFFTRHWKNYHREALTARKRNERDARTSTKKKKTPSYTAVKKSFTKETYASSW